jgi:hypothetical protein
MLPGLNPLPGTPEGLFSGNASEICHTAPPES